MDSVDRLFAWVGSGESQELLIRVAKNNKEKRGVLITSVCQYSFASRKYESMWKLNQVFFSSPKASLSFLTLDCNSCLCSTFSIGFALFSRAKARAKQL